MGFTVGWTDANGNTQDATPLFDEYGRSNIPRVTKGAENRKKRLKALGNAVVPGQVYPILRAIAVVESENS